MMWRRLLILDLALVAALAIALVQVRRSWTEFAANHRVEFVQAEAETVRTLPGPGTAAVAGEDWTEISVLNPFSFDRSDVPVLATGASPDQPKPILFGTMSIGNQWIAMLATGESGPRTSRPVKVGESIGGWDVVEIHERSVVVAANGLSETVVLNDRQPRSSERTLSGGGSPSVNVVTPSAASTAAPGTSNSPNAAPPSPAQPGVQPGVRILRTPFGNQVVGQ